MDESPALKNGRCHGTLTRLDPAEQREILHSWRTAASGMDGPRGELPPQPDNAIAHALLEVAELAISQGEVRPAIHILKLVVSDYRDSQEAAFARRVLDQLARQRGR